MARHPVSPPLWAPALLLVAAAHGGVLAWWLRHAPVVQEAEPLPMGQQMAVSWVQPVSSVTTLPPMTPSSRVAAPAPSTPPREVAAAPTAPTAVSTARPVPTATPTPEAVPAPAAVAAPTPPHPPEPMAAPTTAAPAMPAAAPAVTAKAAPPAVVPASFDAAYLDNPRPNYPAVSRQEGEEGTVLLRVRVLPSGLPDQIELAQSSGFDRLDRAARSTVARWRFTPARQGEQTVAAWVQVPISFSLKRAQP